MAAAPAATNIQPLSAVRYAKPCSQPCMKYQASGLAISKAVTVRMKGIKTEFVAGNLINDQTGTNTQC